MHSKPDRQKFAAPITNVASDLPLSAQGIARRVVSYDDLGVLGIPYGRRHLRDLIAEGKFPQPIRLSARRVGWWLSDIDQWLSSRERSHYAKPKKEDHPHEDRSAGTRHDPGRGAGEGDG